MDINHMHLAVGDLQASKRFYESALGFREQIYRGEVLFMENDDGFELALDPVVAVQPLPPWFHFGCRLGTKEEIHAAFARAEPGSIRRPLQEYDDLVSFRLADPDGYVIELYWEKLPVRSA